MSSPSTKARYSPRARSTPRSRAPPGPPCSAWTRTNRGSAAAFARAICALWSVEASSTMITSRSPNDWAPIESRQSPRSSALLKNATTTLILGLLTKPFLRSSDGRRFPAERHRVVYAFHVDLVPQREYDQQPHVPPCHVGITGPETLQDIKRGGLVQPPAGLRRADDPLGIAVHAAAEPVADGNREAQLGPLRGGLGQQGADGLPQRELGGAGGGLLHPGQPRGDREHLAVEERAAQLEAVGHGHPVRLDQDVAGQPGIDVHQLHGGDVVQAGLGRLPVDRVGHVELAAVAVPDQ